MKRKILLAVFLIMACAISAQINYKDSLVRGERTYWATLYSLCHPAWNLGQIGMCFDSNGLFDWFKIPDVGDTLSIYELRDLESFISHRTYYLKNDTIFIACWSTKSDNSIIYEAHKILYLTDQRLVLLELKQNGVGSWEECYRTDDCEFNLQIREFKRVKP